MVNIATSIKRATLAFPLDWTSRRRYRLWDGSPAFGNLGPYYIRWTGGDDALGEEWDAGPFDSAGVLLTLPGPFHHATRIAQYALEQHSRWHETGDTKARDSFLAQAIWLRDNQAVLYGVAGKYPFPFAWHTYGASAGFVSGMTQGEAISVLLRAYELTDDRGFEKAAVAAAAPFQHGIEEGGVVFRGDGEVFLEEAACVPPSHILNGWIYALWGLFELSRRTRIDWVFETYWESLSTLRRQLPLYDSGYWSYYSLLASRRGFRKLATLKYHAFHIAQLHVLASMTGDSEFESTALRWENYTKSTANKIRVWANAACSLPQHLLTQSHTVPGGARSII